MDHLRASGVRWAPQGAADAWARWCADDGPADLDLWVERMPPDVASRLDRLPGSARVVDTRDHRRLRHVTWAVPLDGGLAVVDLTVGDLKVGPLTLVPALRVVVSEDDHDPRLTGAAAVADLLVRPVLRGRLPTGPRLAEARLAWRGLSAAERQELLGRLASQAGRSGRRLADRLVPVLDGRGEVAASEAGEVVRSGRAAMTWASLRPSSLPATWAQRRSILPAGRAAGPLGLRTRGVVVALVGTDGCGKSSVQERLCAELGAIGVPTRSVYFGMARGNLPGVVLARRLLRVGEEAGTPTSDGPSPGSNVAGARARPPRPPRPQRHAGIRRAAAWFYAGEYCWRWLSQVAPGLARREVVVCDRWVTDLRESPWPGSPASRVLERMLPRPAVVVLPDAPDTVIHRRKPERSLAEQSRQQQAFRNLLAERPAWLAEVVVDTSGVVPDVAGAVGAVVEAQHRAVRVRGD